LHLKDFQRLRRVIADSVKSPKTDPLVMFERRQLMKEEADGRSAVEAEWLDVATQLLTCRDFAIRFGRELEAQEAAERFALLQQIRKVQWRMLHQLKREKVRTPGFVKRRHRHVDDDDSAERRERAVEPGSPPPETLETQEDETRDPQPAPVPSEATLQNKGDAPTKKRARSPAAANPRRPKDRKHPEEDPAEIVLPVVRRPMPVDEVRAVMRPLQVGTWIACTWQKPGTTTAATLRGKVTGGGRYTKVTWSHKKKAGEWVDIVDEEGRAVFEDGHLPEEGDSAGPVHIEVVPPPPAEKAEVKTDRA
jgi:hypothetical protein